MDQDQGRTPESSGKKWDTGLSAFHYDGDFLARSWIDNVICVTDTIIHYHWGVSENVQW